MQEKNITSVLSMKKLIFDKLSFQRVGFKNENELEIEFQIGYQKKKDENLYKVTLGAVGNKKDEYIVEIQLIGFFTIDNDKDLSEEFEKSLISKNAVAIMMPYLRSQMTLLTSQPEVESVVLPPFNINNMV